MGNSQRQDHSTAGDLNYCAGCGKQIPRFADFCPHCGCQQLLTSKSDSSGRVGASVSTNDKSSLSSWGWIPTIVVVVIGGLLTVRVLAGLFDAAASSFSDSARSGNGVPAWYFVVVAGGFALWRAIKKMK